MWYSREHPKYAPAMRRTTTTTRSRLRSWKVVQIDNQLPNARQSSKPMVQRTTICALGAQDRGSNPRRLTVPRLGIGEPSGLLCRGRLLSVSRFESGSRRHDNECLPCLQEEAFRHVSLGETTSIDTIGSVRICVTDDGAYFHGTR